MEYLNNLISRFKTNKLKLDDVYYLNELLRVKIPIKDCFELLKNKNNEAIFDSLIKKLNKGKLIEEIIDEYMPKEISLYMKSLLKHLSFNESLTLSLSYYKKSKENAKKLEKAITYPIVLLFISLSALYLFDYYGLDAILNLMNNFNVDTSSFGFIRILMRIIIYVFYFAFIFIALIVLIFMKPKRITLFYIFISKYIRNSLIHTYYTEDFISLFIITTKLGYKTKEALRILKSLDNKPIVSLMAFHMDDKLLEGESLKSASNQVYFDDTLERFINIGSFSLNFTEILNNYVELARSKITNKMKLYTSILQISSYIIIGFVVVFIYQVMFLPMQAINGF